MVYLLVGVLPNVSSVTATRNVNLKILVW